MKAETLRSEFQSIIYQVTREFSVLAKSYNETMPSPIKPRTHHNHFCLISDGLWVQKPKHAQTVHDTTTRNYWGARSGKEIRTIWKSPLIRMEVFLEQMDKPDEIQLALAISQVEMRPTIEMFKSDVTQEMLQNPKNMKLTQEIWMDILDLTKLVSFSSPKLRYLARGNIAEIQEAANAHMANNLTTKKNWYRLDGDDILFDPAALRVSMSEIETGFNKL